MTAFAEATIEMPVLEPNGPARLLTRMTSEAYVPTFPELTAAGEYLDGFLGHRSTMDNDAPAVWEHANTGRVISDNEMKASRRVVDRDSWLLAGDQRAELEDLLTREPDHLFWTIKEITDFMEQQEDAASRLALDRDIRADAARKAARIAAFRNSRAALRVRAGATDEEIEQLLVNAELRQRMDQIPPIPPLTRAVRDFALADELRSQRAEEAVQATATEATVQQEPRRRYARDFLGSLLRLVRA